MKVKETVQNQDYPSREQSLNSCETMLNYIINNNLFIEQIDFIYKILIYAQLFNQEQYSKRLYEKFNKNIEIPFYKFIIEEKMRKEFQQFLRDFKR